MTKRKGILIKLITSYMKFMLLTGLFLYGCAKKITQPMRYPFIDQWVEYQEEHDPVKWKILFRIDGTFSIMREENEMIIREQGTFKMDGQTFILTSHDYGITNALIDYEIAYKDYSGELQLIIFDKMHAVKPMSNPPILGAPPQAEEVMNQYPLAKIYQFTLPSQKNDLQAITKQEVQKKAPVTVKNYYQDYEEFYVQNANHHSWMVESPQYIFYINKQFAGTIYRLDKDTNENIVLAKGLQSLSGLSLFQGRLFFRAQIELLENHLYSINYDGSGFRKETESLYGGILNHNGLVYSTGYKENTPNITVFDIVKREKQTIEIPYIMLEIQINGDELWFTPYDSVNGPGFYKYHLKTKELTFVSLNEGMVPGLVLYQNHLYIQAASMLMKLDPQTMQLDALYHGSAGVAFIKVIGNKIYFVGSYPSEELEGRYPDAIFRMDLDGSNLEKIYEVNLYDENDRIRGMVYINHSLIITSDLAGSPGTTIKAVDLDGAEVPYNFEKDIVDYSKEIQIDDSGYVYYRDGVLHTFNAILYMDKEKLQEYGITKEIMQSFLSIIGDDLSNEEKEKMQNLFD